MAGYDTQEAMAKDIGWSLVSVRDYENGRTMPRESRLEELCEFYDVKLCELFADSLTARPLTPDQQSISSFLAIMDAIKPSVFGSFDNVSDTDLQKILKLDVRFALVDNFEDAKKQVSDDDLEIWLKSFTLLVGDNYGLMRYMFFVQKWPPRSRQAGDLVLEPPMWLRSLYEHFYKKD